jgi:glycosyltransferase involved in cell wall biosynthesis
LVGLPVTVAVSTVGARLPALDLPPPCHGVDYLILVQKPGNAACPARIAERADVTLCRLQSEGLSLSRNAALDHATGALVLFADDDTILSVDGIAALARAFQDDTLDFAAGWRRERLPNAGRRARVRRLHHFNSGRICAPELMVRRSAVADLRFDPEFGLGAPHGLGEEYVFVTDALKAGLRGRSFPVVVGSHPDASTGEDWTAPRLMRARLAVLDRVFGPWVAPVRVLYALRYRRRMGDWRMIWCFARGRMP